MKNKNVVFQTFSLISQLGISMIAPVILCTIAGVWLEEKTSIALTIPFIVLGILAGGRNVYALVRHASKKIVAEEVEENEEE